MEKLTTSIKIHYLLFFIDKYRKKQLTEEADNEQSRLTNELLGKDRGVKSFQKSLSKLYEGFWNKIANDETNANTEIFNEYIMYQNPNFLLKDL